MGVNKLVAEITRLVYCSPGVSRAQSDLQTSISFYAVPEPLLSSIRFLTQSSGRSSTRGLSWSREWTSESRKNSTIGWCRRMMSPTLTWPAMATDLGQPHILARFSQRTRAEEGNDVPPGVRMSALTVTPRPHRPLSPVQQELETRALVFLDADLVRARVSRGRIMR